MTDVTQILSQIESGVPAAADQLLPLVYNELRRMATAKMAQEKPGQTLQATALVHEAYLKLVDSEQAQHWHSRRHFFAAAGEAMRRILVDNARRKSRQKRGGNHRRVELQDFNLVMTVPDTRLLAVDEALSQLEAEAPEKAELVKLRFFAGLTLEQAADSLGISRTTAHRYWAYARVWLYDRIQDRQKSP